MKENDRTPDDLSLFLGSSRPESENYVADLDQDKRIKISGKALS